MVNAQRHPRQLLIAGAGIGGLAAALASARAGWQVRVFEQAREFGEVGAGLQLGPNVTRLLAEWDLSSALESVAAFPGRLRVRSAVTGHDIGHMGLGREIADRYGAPYATLHRADLHALLLVAVQTRDDVALNVDARVGELDVVGTGVQVKLAGQAEPVEGDALVGADGIWSRVRELTWNDGPATPTGHLAYRALVPQAALPAALRSNDVTAWLGPRLHVISYPVRRGELLNLVAFVHGELDGDTEGWDHAAVAADLRASMGPVCTPLQDLLQAAPAWGLWVLCDRMPLAAAAQMVRGRVALLGDAAHPMRPYLAQGAGMAIEDAYVLGQSLALCGELEVEEVLARYARLRWARASRVQARSRRNGRIFHLTGPMRWGRDLSVGLLGRHILDVPWLYGGRL
ncbi:MAG: FAD-dependent monooxygenase [Burkholderiales bacterium]|nr:FAD-dependent monooxygenase [Burkholderiales bacterium]